MRGHTGIEKLLKCSLGLDIASIGTAALERAVRQRAAACGVIEPEAYGRLLQHDPQELQALIELVVVPETWFFRDPAAFEALALAAQRLPQRSLRLLSLPCSTGEEPYSMAMTLLDAGMQTDRFTIDAIDVSQRALEQAQHGEYGRNAFRSRDLGFRDRYFEPTGSERHRLHDGPRRAVRWRQANLFALGRDRGPTLYHVVFCRNLLIYFDRDTQKRALMVLNGLLADGGWLFVGPAEGALLLESGFEWIQLPRAFAFRRKSPATRPALARLAYTPPATPSAPAQWARPPTCRDTEPRMVLARASPAAGADTLLNVARLADQGCLEEAEGLCRTFLRDQPASAQALYLLGLLGDARGDVEQAVDFYRRALYLNPAHEHALLHLAGLREKQGDTAGAKRLQDRARRVREQLQPRTA